MKNKLKVLSRNKKKKGSAPTLPSRRKQSVLDDQITSAPLDLVDYRKCMFQS
jgi:hypothetical protein